jgi:hypothetical protein
MFALLIANLVRTSAEPRQGLSVGSRSIARVSFLSHGPGSSTQKVTMRNAITAHFVTAALLCGAVSAQASTQRTQNIELHAGWNAVFLEVQPNAAKPGEVFGGLPVETVASFFPGRQEAQYLRNPGDAPWREEGWAVWYAPSKSEAFLSNLYEIQALRPLLVRASSDFTLTVTGEARASSLEWYPNTCTFTGLPIDPEAPPTFAQFFAGSTAHQRMRIFRLTNGAWKLVTNPASDHARSGEAYWVQTDGASTYQGPLRVKMPVGGELDFDLHGSGASLKFVNESALTPAQVRIDVTSGPDGLPLRQVTRNPATLQTVRGSLPGTFELSSLAAGQSQSLRLEPDRDAMRGAGGATLLRITDGRGTQLWLPIRARREVVGTLSVQP